MPQLPVIYVITPTFTRPVQKAELTRLSQAFMLVPNLHWIIVEDSVTKTDLVENLLQKTGLPYTHLNIPTPKTYKLTSKVGKVAETVTIKSRLCVAYYFDLGYCGCIKPFSVGSALVEASWSDST